MGGDGLIEDLRRLLSDERCLCSSAHTDWHGVGALLDRLERAEAQVARVASLALNCERRADEDRAKASGGGLNLGEIDALEIRAQNYDLTADGILRALDVSPTTQPTPTPDARGGAL